MSSNRLTYDKCAYATNIKESTAPLEYNLFVNKYENCKTCPVGKYKNVLPFGPKTETESELRGLTRLASNCPEKKYQSGSQFKNMPLSAARMCDSIYYITPNNLEKPTSNMINEKKVAINAKSCNNIEKFESIFDVVNKPNNNREYIDCMYNSAISAYKCNRKCNMNTEASESEKKVCTDKCENMSNMTGDFCNETYPVNEAPCIINNLKNGLNNIYPKIEAGIYDNIPNSEQIMRSDFLNQIKDIDNTC
jgi:hypothetical protein